MIGKSFNEDIDPLISSSTQHGKNKYWNMLLCKQPNEYGLTSYNNNIFSHLSYHSGEDEFHFKIYIYDMKLNDLIDKYKNEKKKRRFPPDYIYPKIIFNFSLNKTTYSTVINNTTTFYDIFNNNFKEKKDIKIQFNIPGKKYIFDLKLDYITIGLPDYLRCSFNVFENTTNIISLYPLIYLNNNIIPQGLQIPNFYYVNKKTDYFKRTFKEIVFKDLIYNNTIPKIDNSDINNYIPFYLKNEKNQFAEDKLIPGGKYKIINVSDISHKPTIDITTEIQFNKIINEIYKPSTSTDITKQQWDVIIEDYLNRLLFPLNICGKKPTINIFIPPFKDVDDYLVCFHALLKPQGVFKKYKDLLDFNDENKDIIINRNLKGLFEKLEKSTTDIDKKTILNKFLLVLILFINYLSEKEKELYIKISIRIIFDYISFIDENNFYLFIKLLINMPDDIYNKIYEKHKSLLSLKQKTQQGGKDNYYQKYLKYKIKYLNLKKY